MRVQILYGFRGRETKEHYYPKGEHEIEDKLALYLIANGHAIALDEIAVMPDVDKAVSQLYSKMLDDTDDMMLNLVSETDVELESIPHASLDELRKFYQEKTGKKAYHGWNAATLEQKLVEWDSDHA